MLKVVGGTVSSLLLGLFGAHVILRKHFDLRTAMVHWLFDYACRLVASLHFVLSVGHG